MDCSYCVLQGYVNVPAITIFVNVEDLLAGSRADGPKSRRGTALGTGEFGDSLALDSLDGPNERLIPWFAGSAAVFTGNQEQAAVKELARKAMWLPSSIARPSTWSHTGLSTRRLNHLYEEHRTHFDQYPRL